MGRRIHKIWTVIMKMQCLFLLLIEAAPESSPHKSFDWSKNQCLIHAVITVGWSMQEKSTYGIWITCHMQRLCIHIKRFRTKAINRVLCIQHAKAKPMQNTYVDYYTVDSLLIPCVCVSNTCLFLALCLSAIAGTNHTKHKQADFLSCSYMLL